MSRFKKTKKAMAGMAIVGMTLTMVPLAAFAGTGVTTSNLYGADRIATSVAVANQGWSSAGTAILAPSGDANLVDALAAAPLAGKTIPILLTDNNTLSAAAQAELTKLGVKNVYVVGAISQNVVNQVNALGGITTTVLKGTSRTGTAAAIAARLSSPAGSFVVGYNALADALSVASFAAANNYSILVANQDGTLPASEQPYLGSKVYIIGGPTLVQNIANATRIYGNDRYGTNQDVIDTLGYSFNPVYVASGMNNHLVDSLVGSPLAAMTDSPIVLADGSNGTSTLTDVGAKIGNNGKVVGLGGPSVVTSTVLNEAANPTSVPVSTGAVSISNLSVSGQTVGNGTAASPAVATINNPLTVNASISGPNTANSTVTYLVTNSNNITATANGQILSADNLSTPVIIGNDRYTATYTVGADASGNVSISFTSTASSNSAFNVIVQAPYYNNGKAVQSNKVVGQWGVPGTLVLSPLYSSSAPDNLSFSNSASETTGLVPVVATYLGTTGSSMAGQSVKFTMTAQSATQDATAFFTDSTGIGSVGQNAAVSTSTIAPPSATYNVTTDSNGQAVIYINANQPSTNGVADLGANMEVSVQAQLVNGGGSTNSGYYKWQTVAQAAQIANVSPSQMLNPTGLSATSTSVSNAAETATSGSQITISGTLEDAAGNPVTSARLAIQDYDVLGGGSSNNIQNDAFVQNGTSTLFSATSFPVVTTDANGQFSLVVTANVPVTQSLANSATQYYIYDIPNTVSIASGQSLPTSGITSMTFVGNNNGGNYINLVWEQGQTIQAAAVSTSPLQVNYAGITAVPTATQSFTNVLGSDEELYAAGFNQNGIMIAPTSASSAANQFAGYGLDFNITLPGSMTIDQVGNTNGANLPWVAANAVPSAVDFQYYNGQLYLHTWTNATTGVVTTLDTPFNDPAAYDGSGQLIFYVNSVGTNATAGAVNVEVQAYSGITTGATSLDTTNGQGGASTSITANFTGASQLTSLGIAGNITSMMTYQPLKNGNAAPANTATVSGTAYDGYDMGNNASFVVAPFNSQIAIATVPTQSINYTMIANDNGKLRAIDGYQLQSAPQTAQVNVAPSGVVSVNNVSIWPSLTGTVLGYNPVSATSGYLLAQSGNIITAYSYNPSSPSSAPAAVEAWDATGMTLKQPYEGFLGFEISGSTLIVNATNNVTVPLATGSTAALSSMTFAPVQAVTAYVSDKYAESPTVTVTNSVNSQSATVTTVFGAGASSSGGAVSSVLANPQSFNFSVGGSQNVTLTAIDGFGNSIANQTIYLVGNSTNNLWITQVNGAAVQQSINLGSATTPSFQTVNTPVPLFNVAAILPGGTSLDYNSVYDSGILSANNLQSGTPYVALITGASGTINFTVADGNVQYYTITGTSAAVSNIDSGNGVRGSLDFYATNPGSSTTAIASLPVNVSGGAIAATVTGLAYSSSIIIPTSTTTADTVAVAPTVKDANGNTLSNTGTYAISGPSGATGVSINSGTGVVTVAHGATVGTYTASYTQSGIKDSVTLTVQLGAPATITGLGYASTTLTPPATGNITDAVSVVPTVKDAYGNALSNSGTYSLTGPLGATGVSIDSSTGTVTVANGATAGSYSAIYNQGGVTDSVNLTVATGVVASSVQTQAFKAGTPAIPATAQEDEWQVTSGATTAGSITVNFSDGSGYSVGPVTVNVTTGDTASVVAGEISTALDVALSASNYTAAPSGADVTVSQTTAATTGTWTLTSSDPNGTGVTVGSGSVLVAYSAGSPAVSATPETETITVSSGATGTGSVSVLFNDGTINTTVTAAVTAGDPTSTVATAIAGALNGNSAINAAYTVTAVGNLVTVTQKSAASATITISILG